ncbi:hypothetical protein [Fischerella sp. FACHB-380]|uniref:hypothetical protein n=1 Tax=Fischerella sp. FACHB-380 TaxID=2692799 RepID=UPI0012FC31D8|nr:hypothetical protein [Fischerella sp. FACHB-380]
MVDCWLLVVGCWLLVVVPDVPWHVSTVVSGYSHTPHTPPCTEVLRVLYPTRTPYGVREAGLRPSTGVRIPFPLP